MAESRARGGDPARRPARAARRGGPAGDEPRRGAVRGALAPPDPSADRAALAIWITLIALLAARVASQFVPSMAAWGLNVARFVPAWAAWLLTLAAGLALVPGVARRLLPALDAAGEFLARGRGAAAAAAAATAALVLALPDRAWYVGDFLLRQGAVEQGVGAARVFPQALPLDRLLHNSLPTWCELHLNLDANATGRLLGAMSAAVLAWAAVTFVRALALRGATACAAAAVIVLGGYLAVFTGYSKAVVELCALTAAAGACALRVIRSGRGLGAFGVVLALAFLLHRSAVGLLPGAVITWLAGSRRDDARAALRDPRAIAGLVLPWVALAVVLPRVLHTFVTVDMAVHLEPADVRARGGMLATAFAGLRALDMANVVVMLTPLVLAAPVALLARGRPPAHRGEGLTLVAFALPLVGVMPVLHPVQGMFRDWDNFVAGGAATSVLVAWLLADPLSAASRARWVAVPVAVCTTAFTLQWMVAHADAARGMARVSAFLDEPPRRGDAERVPALDYLGIRNMRLERYAESAAAFRAAADLAPNPRFMIQWGLAATEAHDDRGALEAYERLLARTPDDPLAWRGYTAMTSRLGDLVNARRGAIELLKRVPGDPDALRLLQDLDREQARRAANGAPPPRATAPTSP